VPDSDPQDLPGDDATLEAILAAAWWLLERAAAVSAEDWHWPVLAGVDARDAARPRADARVVVLRAADRGARTLEIHSDLRAHKLSQLRACPAACLVFHDRRRELQLRAWADASVHAGDAVALRAWERLGASSRRAYLAPRTPGTVSDAPDANLPERLHGRLPDAHEAQAGFASFAAIVLRLRGLEWLRLDRHGHRRARFEWPAAAEGPASAAWIRP
jgi:hypothetical protein